MNTVTKISLSCHLYMVHRALYLVDLQKTLIDGNIMLRNLKNHFKGTQKIKCTKKLLFIISVPNMYFCCRYHFNAIYTHSDHVSIKYEPLWMLPDQDIWEKLIFLILLLSHFDQELMSVFIYNIDIHGEDVDANLFILLQYYL